MHHIHTTNGFIIRSINHGEANKIVYIFTQDFGLIVAIAQGVRYEKSKLRYNIRDFCFTKFSLVHGKEFWRLVGADDIAFVDIDDKNTFSIKQEILCRVSLLLMRLVHGEERNEQIYECVWNFYNFDFKFAHNNQDYFGTVESLLVLRILYWLGYISDNLDFVALLKKVDFDDITISNLIEKRILMNKLINGALRESHL